MAQQLGVICRLSIAIFEEEGAIIAKCKDLNISNHGKEREEAIKNLMASVNLYFDVCAEKGTLFKVLSERGVLHTRRAQEEPDNFIEIPIPPTALKDARNPAHRT